MRIICNASNEDVYIVFESNVTKEAIVNFFNFLLVIASLLVISFKK